MSFFISSRNLLGSILNSQTDTPTLENADFTLGILTFLKKQRCRSKDGFESVLGLSRAPFGSSWGSLGSSLGPLDRPKRASRFVLELSWAWFARFLLPKMALGTSWGCFWLVWGAPEGLLRLVLGAPEGLLRVVLASGKPISTIKTAFPSFGTLFYLAVVVVVLVSLLPCNLSSTRPGGMREAIEFS